MQVLLTPQLPLSVSPGTGSHEPAYPLTDAQWWTSSCGYEWWTPAVDASGGHEWWTSLMDMNDGHEWWTTSSGGHEWWT